MNLFKRKKVAPPTPIRHVNHIRYIGTNTPVCSKPEWLGSDFVVIDTRRTGSPCPYCMPLVRAHNEGPLRP